MTDTGRSGAAPRWRGLAFNVAFYGWTTMLLPAGLAAAALSPAALRGLGRFWARSTLWLLAAIVGLRYRIRGIEHLPDGPAMLAVKHQSAWETVALNFVVRDPAFVLKRELTRIPVFGWLLPYVGMIAVDRSGGATALRSMVAAARAAVAAGLTVVIFPEGTRVPPGEHRPYHPGVAALYRALGVPVVPVALNSGLFWPRRSMRLAAGLITVEFLPAIPPGLPRDDFTARLQATIEGATDRLVGEAVDIQLYPQKPTGR